MNCVSVITLLLFQQTHVVIDNLPNVNRSGNVSEWVSAAAAVIFGLGTIVLVARQVAVMRQQNLLVRWQHEHEWIRQNNAERAQVLELTKRLHIAINTLREESPNSNGIAWTRISDTALELSRCLSLFDEPPQKSNAQNDDWFILLVTYVDCVLKTIAKDQQLHETFMTDDDDLPTFGTIRDVKKVDAEVKPLEIIAQIGMTIRSQFVAFTEKWDKQFPA